MGDFHEFRPEFEAAEGLPQRWSSLAVGSFGEVRLPLRLSDDAGCEAHGHGAGHGRTPLQAQRAVPIRADTRSRAGVSCVRAIKVPTSEMET